MKVVIVFIVASIFTYFIFETGYHAGQYVRLYDSAKEKCIVTMNLSPDGKLTGFYTSGTLDLTNLNGNVQLPETMRKTDHQENSNRQINGYVTGGSVGGGSASHDCYLVSENEKVREKITCPHEIINFPPQNHVDISICPQGGCPHYSPPMPVRVELKPGMGGPK